MRIENYNSKYNTNFGAKHLAKITTTVIKKKQVIDLYALDSSDKIFSQKMFERINLEKLYPDVPEKKSIEVWKNIIFGAIAKIGQNATILAVRDKRPCAIMSYSTDGEGGINLDYLAKWRTKPLDETNHIGKILIHLLIENAKKNGAEQISLIPSSLSIKGKSSMKFYESMGFTLNNHKMIMPNFVFSMRIAQLENFFEKSASNNNDYIDACKAFKLSFEDTFREKFVNKTKPIEPAEKVCARRQKK